MSDRPAVAGARMGRFVDAGTMQPDITVQELCRLLRLEIRITAHDLGELSADDQALFYRHSKPFDFGKWEIPA